MDLNHKLNRERSSSAKWASDVHLAVEYLKRQHEVIEWLQHAMDRPMPTHDLQELLKSGVVLRELMSILAPTSATPKPIARYLTRHESNSDVSTLREPEPASEVTTKEPAVFGDVRIQSVGLPASPSTSDLHAVSDNTVAVNHTHHEQVESGASSSPTTRDDDEAMGTPTEQYVLATTPILTDPPSDQVSSHTAILPSVQLNAISDDAAVPEIDPSMHRVRYGCCCRVM
ncbi:hypothetical protein DYB38_010574 [Aphanomyces astaci]|uniref:Calponin-homology (CH) domain-containing protein n=1 Tax=Aphanomyces astaci TaxID=112090 RepID=A0A397DW69_APHAT|nr:hypothetical protein DYB38_010574 [Aphanomyces astaci]